jgi:hypothetical protein
MNHRLAGIVGAALLLSVKGVAVPAVAADAITLKVALTDISSAWGWGRRAKVTA